MDFSEQFTYDELEKVWKENKLDQLDISIMVNQATAYPEMNTFETLPSDQTVHDIVATNCYLSLFLSKLAIENFKRRQGTNP